MTMVRVILISTALALAGCTTGPVQQRDHNSASYRLSATAPAGGLVPGQIPR